MSLTLALTFWFFNGFFKRLICTFLSLMDFIVATQCSHLSNRFYDFDLYIYIYIFMHPLLRHVLFPGVIKFLSNTSDVSGNRFFIRCHEI